MPKPNFKKVYFIGIGGIGMSALARYFKFNEVEVVGSDRDLESESVKSLIRDGINVYDQNNIHESDASGLMFGVDCVVYTLAIPDENPEITSSKNLGLPMFTYAEMLGKVSEGHFTIAVSGTHGKTTTTGMCAEIAHNLGLQPNVIVGSFLNWKEESGETKQTNFVHGDSDLFIVEACEYKRSFLNLHPNILIITNLEADHLDYYKDLADVQSAFYDLSAKLPEDGKIVCDINDENVSKIVRDFPDKIIDYSAVAHKIPEMKVFGDHNNKNAAAAVCAIAAYSGLDLEKVSAAVSTFSGTWRRMEYKGETGNGTLVYDDYGHHPTEISATISAFREHFPNKKIAVVFQPHLHSRTKMFFDDFVSNLLNVDSSIVYPIYRARAEDDYGVSSQILVDAVNEKGGEATFSDVFSDIAEKIEKLSDEWIVILLGAGETYQIADLLKFEK